MKEQAKHKNDEIENSYYQKQSIFEQKDSSVDTDKVSNVYKKYEELEKSKDKSIDSAKQDLYVPAA